jgi:hypothetical protein
MRKKTRVACAAALGMGAAVFGSSPAWAQSTTPTCASLLASNSVLTPSAKVVYIAGSSASQIPLEALAPVVASKNIAIIYQSPDSCQGVNDLLTGTAELGKPLQFLDPAQKSSQGLAKAVQCTNTAAPPIDIAPSDVFPDTCGKVFTSITAGQVTTKTTPVRDFLGPIQAMTFAVPSGSSAASISAEAAYVVFGYDATTFSVTPWTVPGAILTRPYTSGTLNMLGTAIGLAPKLFKNSDSTAPGFNAANQEGGTGNMQSALATPTLDPKATIGELSYEAVVGATSVSSSALKILAYKHSGQSCGYFPSQTASSVDMINVRQGRYAIWGPLHFVVNVDSSGNPLDGNKQPSTAVSTLMNYVLASGPTPPASSSADGGIADADLQTLITAEAKPGYVVPWCAMQAQRDGEMATPTSYQSSTPCGCYYESVLGVSTSSYCHTCTDPNGTANGSCTGSYPVCRYGFCEAK